jgi:hypothetical protein
MGEGQSPQNGEGIVFCLLTLALSPFGEAREKAGIVSRCALFKLLHPENQKIKKSLRSFPAKVAAKFLRVHPQRLWLKSFADVDDVAH